MTSAIRPEFRERPVRSFVIRGGRMTDAQEKALAELWPRFGLSIETGLLEPKAVFGRDAPRILEIGFGMGDSLISMASDSANEDFIGVEVHPPGVGRLLNEAARRDLHNLRVYCADATDVLRECIADSSLHRIQIYFPDPWHKKRHHKRRLIQPAFLHLVQQKLMPGAVLHLATDWQPYAEYMMETLHAMPGWINTAGANQYSARPDYRPMTKFEQRGQRLGHGVWDILFAKA